VSRNVWKKDNMFPKIAQYRAIVSKKLCSEKSIFKIIEDPTKKWIKIAIGKISPNLATGHDAMS
jgi:hypothetical protein